MHYWRINVAYAGNLSLNFQEYAQRVLDLTVFLAFRIGSVDEEPTADNLIALAVAKFIIMNTTRFWYQCFRQVRRKF